jgi:hypothetical protein
MKEIDVSEINWNKNNCPACGYLGMWKHQVRLAHNKLCDDPCLAMECLDCGLLYDGVVWESRGKYYEKE